jgi:hypothetical protein
MLCLSYDRQFARSGGVMPRWNGHLFSEEHSSHRSVTNCW